MNSPAHITRGDVFDELGFSSADALVLKAKARILSALLERIRERKYSQRQLSRLLDDEPANVKKLLGGKISSMSMEKLLKYAQRLNLEMETYPAACNSANQRESV